MRIGFSARGLSIRSGGVRQFIMSLMPALIRQMGNDELFIFYNDEKFLGLVPGCSEVLIKGRNRLFWDFVLLPRMLKKLRIDAAIFPKNVVPFYASTPCFVVVHDLAHFDKELNAYPLLDTIYMRTMMPRSLRRATHIFAVSENTKTDIIRYTNCSAEKVTVIYEAADDIYKPIRDEAALDAVRNKLDLPNKFILYVGSLSPRKNITTLLHAFATISSKIPHNLVFTASKSWKDKQVYKTIEDLNLVKRINKLGYVSAEDMPALYNLAGVLVYPSLYEGFGLPILEAMQCGCPVVASNATSIPEVAGDAAVLVNPLDVAAIAREVHRVLTDKQLQERLIRRGFQQAENFSWQKCAKTIVDKIRDVNSYGFRA